jgi:hypothetical protein
MMDHGAGQCRAQPCAIADKEDWYRSLHRASGSKG